MKPIHLFLGSQALDVSFHRVRLVKGEEIVDGPVPLRHKSGEAGEKEVGDRVLGCFGLEGLLSRAKPLPLFVHVERIPSVRRYGPVLVSVSGWVGDVELQLILEDRSDTIRAVQKELLAAGRCEDLELGLSDEEVLAAENRSERGVLVGVQSFCVRAACEWVMCFFM